MSDIEFLYTDKETKIYMGISSGSSTSEVTRLFYNFMVTVGHAPCNIREALEDNEVIDYGSPGGTD